MLRLRLDDPYNLESFGKSLLATSLFAHNFLLIRQSGYWAAVAEFNPLLHTWSLGIKAQYYLVVPVMAAACRSGPLRLWPILFGLAAASLGPVSWADLHGASPASTFCRRAPGSPCSAASHPAGCTGTARWPGSGRCRQILIAAGLMLILLAVLVFDFRRAGSGLAILVPTGGAVLVIAFARDGTSVARILSSRVMVATGLMSYSVYLWYLLPTPRPLRPLLNRRATHEPPSRESSAERIGPRPIA